MGILQNKHLQITTFFIPLKFSSQEDCLLGYFEGELIFQPGSQEFEQNSIIMRSESNLKVGHQFMTIVIPVNSPLTWDILT